MSTLQIRNVPAEVSRTFKSRAAAQGQSLSDYLLGELTRLAERPTMREVLARIEQRGRVDLPAAEDVLAEQRLGR